METGDSENVMEEGGHGLSLYGCLYIETARLREGETVRCRDG